MISAEAQWSAVLANAGVTSPGVASDAGLTRVLTAVPGIASHSFSDVGVLLALRLAATSDAAHERIREVDEWYHQRRRSDRDSNGTVVATPAYHPRSIAIAVLTFLVAAVGPALAFPSVRTSSDYFLPLEPASVGSGTLALVSAVWFLIAEIVRIPYAGTRTRLYGPLVFFVPIGLVAMAIVTTVIRVNSESSMYGLIPLGLTLQFAAVVLYVVAAVRAVRNRAQIVNAVEAPTGSWNQEDLDHALRSRMDVALARASSADYDRGAAVEGVRKLLELGDMSSKQAESALRSLLN